MSAPPPPPLDERQWQRPEIPQWYQTEGPKMGFPWASTYLHENMIHRYLAESDFFDYTCKNGMPIDQSSTDPGAWALTHNRRDFEHWLSQRDGVEYVLVDGASLDPSTDPPRHGIWVIRKQDRRKPAAAAAGARDELATLGTYFLIRENMYQAPSVADLVGNRLLAATASLADFFDQAASLPRWAPATGYSYLPPSHKAGAAAATTTSRSGSPSRSREGSVAPGTDSQSLRSASVQPSASQQTTAGVAERDAASDGRRMVQSLQVSLRYGDECADENPVVGEPGRFSFSSSTAAVKKRKADEEAAAARVKELAAAKAATTTTPGIAPKAEKPPSPPAVMTESKAGRPDRDRRGGKMGDRVRRKKSKANIVQGPSTPLSAVSASAP